MNFFAPGSGDKYAVPTKGDFSANSVGLYFFSKKMVFFRGKYC